MPEARRGFAQTVASRIYLDLYQEQQSSLPPTLMEGVEAPSQTPTDISNMGQGQGRAGSGLPPRDTYKGEAPQDGVRIPKRKLDDVFPETGQ